MGNESLVYVKGEYIVKSGISISKRHQIEEELLKKEREFAALIYYQRDQERL